MEKMELQQAADAEIVDEIGVMEPSLTANEESGAPIADGESTMEVWEDVSTEPAEQATDGQQTETVKKPCDQVESLQAIGLLQAEFDALSAAFPGELPFTHLADMPRLGAFLTLREKGLSSREAYLAIEGERRGVSHGVSHLRAAAPRVTVPSVPTLLSRETLAEWRRLFPHLSDREIGELYRRTATNET